MDVELWNRQDVVSVIKGRFEALAGSGIISCHIETASLMDVELWNRQDVVSVIKGRFEALAGSGIISCHI